MAPGDAGCDMMRTHPICVIGQEAQPCPGWPCSRAAASA